jgi:hypothetical protein
MLTLERLHLLRMPPLRATRIRRRPGCHCFLLPVRPLQRLELLGMPLLHLLQLCRMLPRRHLLLLEPQLIELAGLLGIAPHQPLLTQGVIAFQ